MTSLTQFLRKQVWFLPQGYQRYGSAISTFIRFPHYNTLWLTFGVGMFFNGLALFLSPNLLLMAVWFTLTHLIKPALLFVAGVVMCRIFYEGHKWSVLRYTLLLIVTLTITLPIPLAVVNALPWKRGSETVTARVTGGRTYDAPFGATSGVILSLKSDRTGPMIRLILPHGHPGYRSVEHVAFIPPVELKVYTGFIGMPAKAEFIAFHPTKFP